MDYKEKYEQALEKAKKILEFYKHPAYTEVYAYAKEDISGIFPELAESEDEKIRKTLINYFNTFSGDYYGELKLKDIIAWLEKQQDNTNIEQVFRPLAGCCIDTAAKQAIEQQKIGKNVVLAFNGCYIPVENNTVDEIVNKYNAWLKKQGEQKEINLVEILKHYPRETELYSPLYGKLWLAEVNEEQEIITCYKHPLKDGCTRADVEQEDTVSFYSNGTTGLPDFKITKDCMLFLYDTKKQDEESSWSEEDEKIFNTLIHDIQERHPKAMWIINSGSTEAVSTKYIIDWLKSLKTRCKGGVEPVVEDDKKIEPKVKPKFKVGDWISCYYSNCKVKEINDEGYIAEDADGNKISILFENEKFYHLWTIKDAKDGDVLVSSPSHQKDHETGEQIFIFKCINNRDYADNCIEYYCHVYNREFYVNKTGYMGTTSSPLYPASKEQRSLLFQKMKEAGYVWDEKELKLRKI